MYGCPENFQDSLTKPTATFHEIFDGLLFRSKFVVLPIPEIIGGTQKKFGKAYAHAPFSPKF